MRYAFIGQYAKARSIVVDDLRLVNGFAEAVQSQQGKTAVAVYGTPGLRLFGTCGGGGGMRGLYTTAAKRTFGVQGGGFYEVLASGTTTLLGTLLTSTGPVSIADNDQQLVVVDGPNGYVFILASNVFAQITDPDFQGADTVAFIDGYFVFNKPGTGQFYITALYSTDFDALDFANAEGAADYLLSVVADHRELWLGGTTTIEVWFDAGTEFPFQRVQGAYIEYGVASSFAMTQLANTVYWVGGNKDGGLQAFKAEGYIPRPVSTHPVETAWQAYATTDDVLVWGEQSDGHEFLWVTFPTEDHSWVYDAKEGLWHERSYREPLVGTEQRHRANCYTYAFGEHLVGDYATGALYALDWQRYDDNGEEQVFEITLPPVYNSETGDRVKHTQLRLDALNGVGLDGGVIPGSDPQVMMQTSNDGGRTWGNEHWKSLGLIGQTKRLVQWQRLGQARDRRYRLRMSDAVPRVILGAYLDTEPLNS